MFKGAAQGKGGIFAKSNTSSASTTASTTAPSHQSHIHNFGDDSTLDPESSKSFSASLSRGCGNFFNQRERNNDIKGLSLWERLFCVVAPCSRSTNNGGNPASPRYFHEGDVQDNGLLGEGFRI